MTTLVEELEKAAVDAEQRSGIADLFDTYEKTKRSVAAREPSAYTSGHARPAEAR